MSRLREAGHTAPCTTPYAVVTFRAFSLAVRQLGDPRILLVLAKSLAITLAVTLVLGALLWWGVGRWLQWLTLDPDWVGLARALTAILLLALGWLVFRMIAMTVIDLFGDEVVRAVERRHYPGAVAEAKAVPFARALRMGLTSAGLALLLNLLAAPFYLLLLPTGVGLPILFLVLNALLLARELGDMVAARHLPGAAMRGWRTASRGPRMAMGLVVSGMFMVPLLGLLAPVIGAAMATHLFHLSAAAGRRRAA